MTRISNNSGQIGVQSCSLLNYRPELRDHESVFISKAPGSTPENELARVCAKRDYNSMKVQALL